MIRDELRTRNLLLRPFAVADGPAVYAYWKSDPNWERFNDSVPSGFSEADAEVFVLEMSGRDRRKQPNWALVHEGRVVGVVSLSFAEGAHTATIGYGIHAGLRGKGLCAEATREVLKAASAECPELEEVRAYTDSANLASIRVLEKLGFSRMQDDDAPAGATFRWLRHEAGFPTCLA